MAVYGCMSMEQILKMKKSEVVFYHWLRGTGFKDIQYVGGEEGPPDFKVVHKDEVVAIEGTRMMDALGWDETTRIAFECEVRRTIASFHEENPKAPRWHLIGGYDPVEPNAPSAHGSDGQRWKQVPRNALADGQSASCIQLLRKEARRGRGVYIRKCPNSGNETTFNGMQDDEGSMVSDTLSDRILNVAITKSGKVVNSHGREKYARWWLLIDDEVNYALCSSMTDEERNEIISAVANCDSVCVWDKVILVSRFMSDEERGDLPVRSWVVYDAQNHTG